MIQLRRALPLVRSYLIASIRRTGKKRRQVIQLRPLLHITNEITKETNIPNTTSLIRDNNNNNNLVRLDHANRSVILLNFLLLLSLSHSTGVLRRF